MISIDDGLGKLMAAAGVAESAEAVAKLALLAVLVAQMRE
jgi:hypothetical protein